MYENEIYWSNLLAGDLVLKIYEHGELKTEPGFYILQEYAGPDLLHYYDKKVLKCIDDPINQLIDMFKFFKEKNVYKLNNAMSNLTNDGGRIRAFDFKYAVSRTTETRLLEIESINKWLSKIDHSLKDILLEFV